MIRILQDRREAESFLLALRSRLRPQEGAPRLFNTFGIAQPVPEIVAEILRRVQRGGDHAVAEMVELIDGVKLKADELFVSEEEMAEARLLTPEDMDTALKVMAGRIRDYAQSMMPATESWMKDEHDGRRLGHRFTPLARVGAYVPGGLAGSTPLISSVLMNLIPAVVAGVEELVVATPCNSQGKVHPYLLRACELAGVKAVYRVGGAQGIAAMAYGTASLKPCDKITGPGNAFVQEAKQQLFGLVDIDMMAGPSEIAIIADENAKPAWLAADMLAQAEHDAQASSVLFSHDKQLLEQVGKAVQDQLAMLPRREIASRSLESYAALVLTSDLMESCELSNIMAPEHLELSVGNPQACLSRIRHAGAIFMGYYTPEVVGDYTAGPSHTLPTCGAARYTSGITVYTYLKSSSLLQYDAKALAADIEVLGKMARAEQLEGHARSGESRLPKKPS